MDAGGNWARRLVIITAILLAGSMLFGSAAFAPAASASESAGLSLSLVVAGDDTDILGTPSTGMLSLFDLATSPPGLQALGTGSKQSYDGDGGTVFVDIDAKDNVIVTAAQDAGWQLFEILDDGDIQLRFTSQGGPRTGGGFAEAMSIALVGGAGSDLYAYVGWAEDPEPGVLDGMSDGGIDVYRVTPRSVTRVHRMSDLGVVGAFALEDQRLLAGASHCGGFTGWCSQTLYVLDVSSPSSPRIVGEGPIVEGPGSFASPLSIAIGGTFALVADGEDVHLVNIGRMNSDPSPFVTRETPGEAMAVGVADDRFYIADGSNGFIAGSISALLADADSELVRAEEHPAAPMLSPDLDVAIDDLIDRAYVANGTDSIRVYDVSQREPRYLTSFNVDGYAHALQTFAYAPGSDPESITVRTYLRDLPEGAEVRNGDRVWFCFSVSRPVHIKWWWYHPVSGWYLEDEYDDDGTGECRLSNPMDGIGIRRFRIEAHEGGQLLASHETYFYVVEDPGTPGGVSTYPAEYPSRSRLPDGAQVPANEKMYICFTLDRDTNVEFRVAYEGCSISSSCSLIHSGPYDAPGLCREYTPRLPAGLREMRLRTYDAGGTIATAASSFYVYDPNVPRPTPCDDETEIVELPASPRRVERGSSFELGFTLRNSGTCTWSKESGYHLTYTGEYMGIGNALPLPNEVPPGQEVDFRFTLTAPEDDGDYHSVWQMSNGESKFGDPVLSSVEVVPPQRDSYVLFVHGWQGTQEIGFDCEDDGYREYAEGNEFGKLTESLFNEGFRVFFLHYDSNKYRTAALAEAASCVFRQAEQIRDEHPDLKDKKRIVIAHSMGGLVARNLVSIKRYSGDRIVTFGSPHRGVHFEAFAEMLRVLLLPQLDCSRDPGTCQLGPEWVDEVFNVANPLNAPLNAVGGTGDWVGTRGLFNRLWPLPPTPNDGIIPLDSSLGHELDGSRRPWLVRDTHFDWPGPSLAKPYRSGGDSRACLEEILELEGLTDGDVLARCDSVQGGFSTQDERTALHPSAVNQATSGWVDGVSATGQIPADSAISLDLPLDGDRLAMSVSWKGGELSPTWIDPNGESLSLDSLRQRYPGTTVEVGSSQFVNLMHIEVPAPATGEWKLKLAEQAGVDTDYYFRARHESSIRLVIDVPKLVREQDSFRLSAEVLNGTQQLTPSEISATWMLNGQLESEVLTRNARTGHFDARIDAPAGIPGMAINFSAFGRSPDGIEYVRNTDILVSIVSPDILPPKVERIYLPMLHFDITPEPTEPPTSGSGCRSGAEIEPNDLIPQAMLVCEGSEVTASLSPSDESDYFIVEVPEERLVDITIWDYEPSNEPRVSLHDLDGSDISIELLRDPGLTRLARRLFPGKYAVRIGRGAGSSGGTYRLVWHLR